VMVNNVLVHMKPSAVDKKVKEWISNFGEPSKVKVTKTKKPNGQRWMKLTLETEEMVDYFVDQMNANKIDNGRGECLIAAKALSTTPDNISGKKREGEWEGEGEGKSRRKDSRSQVVPPPLNDDGVRDKLTPLWRLTYEKQLEQKWTELRKKCAMKIAKEIQAIFRHRGNEARRNPKVKIIPVYAYLSQKPAIKVHPILPSPVQQEYRNKCEFTFGYHQTPAMKEAGSKPVPAVGFLAAGWNGGVSLPHICSNIPTLACGIADVLNTFLSKSPIPPYDCKKHTGIWRTVTVRISKRTKECMVLILHAPPSGGAGVSVDGSNDFSASWEKEKKRSISMLVKFYVHHEIILKSSMIVKKITTYMARLVN